MATYAVALIALDIRKWDLESRKVSLTAFCVVDDEEKSYMFEQSLTELPEMVEEFLGKMKQYIEKYNDFNDSVVLELDNETFVRQKVLNYFKRITTELYGKKRKRRRQRVIFTTHMDLYNENQDISFLSPVLQFYVALNWARKYYENEDFLKAQDPLKKLIRIKPDFGLAYKWLARSLKKVRKYDEAMQNYEKYASITDTPEAYLELAQSYRKGRLFDKSLPIYQKVLETVPDNRDANIGLAQIYYAQKNDAYLEILDKLNALDANWLKKWLKTEFNFRIYQSPKTLFSPTQAASYLGLDQVFDLTQRAFKNEVPSHFNSGRAKMNFFKEELDSWALIMNRYSVENEDVVLYPNAIDFSEVEQVEEGFDDKKPVVEVVAEPVVKKSKSDVEEIIRQILAKKKAINRDENANKSAKNTSVKKNGARRKNGAQNNQSKISEKLGEASSIMNETLAKSEAANNKRNAARKPAAKRRGRPKKVENI